MGWDSGGTRGDRNDRDARPILLLLLLRNTDNKLSLPPAGNVFS